MFLTNLSSNMFTTKSIKYIGILLCISIAINLIDHPYPEKLQQPMKYRFLSAGAEFLNLIGHVFEYFNLGHRLDLTRFAYHWTIGAFNIREPKDRIHIFDENIEHISMRVYRPIDKIEPMPTIIFYHGGGHFVGSADILEPINYLLVKHTNFQVVYIEFRLIPEHKFPAALTDSLIVTKHLLNNINEYKIDLNNIILMGDSAGGNLATVIGQKLIEQKLCEPKLQVLVYPILQFFDFTLPSYRINMPKRILGTMHYENYKNFLHYLTGLPVDDSVFFNGHTTGLHKDSLFSQYVNADLLPTKYKNHQLGPIQLMNDTTGKYTVLTDIILSKDLSPLLVSDDFLLENTPSNTFLITAELDILRDDGFIYAERLKRLGLNIHHKHYEDMFHGLLNLLHGPLKFDQSVDLLIEISNVIKNVVQN